jgi:hypothetical protein
MPISYSDYKSLVNILDKSGETTYEDLMKKEKNILSAVNSTVHEIKDKNIKSGQFVNMSISESVQKFFLVWKDILNDIIKAKNYNDIMISFTKEDRIIFIGVFIVIIAFLFSL